MEEKSIFSKLKEILEAIFGSIVVMGVAAAFIYGIFMGGQNIFYWIKYNTGDSLVESYYIDEISPGEVVLDFKQIENKWGPLDEEYRKLDVEYGNSDEIIDIYDELLENPGDCSEWMVNTYAVFSNLLYEIDRLYNFDESSRGIGGTFYLSQNLNYPNRENATSHIYLNLAILTFFSEIEIEYTSENSRIYEPDLSYTSGYINEMLRTLTGCPEDELLIGPESELSNKFIREQSGLYVSDLPKIMKDLAGLDWKDRMNWHEIFTIPVFYDINDISSQD